MKASGKTTNHVNPKVTMQKPGKQSLASVQYAVGSGSRPSMSKNKIETSAPANEQKLRG